MKSSQKLSTKAIDPYFIQWEKLKIELQIAHHVRSKLTAALMEQGIRLFTALIEECEGELKPLNFQDRIDFISSHSANYAAFRQLDELFLEMKKTISSKRVQLNNRT